MADLTPEQVAVTLAVELTRVRLELGRVLTRADAGWARSTPPETLLVDPAGRTTPSWYAG